MDDLCMEDDNVALYVDKFVAAAQVEFLSLSLSFSLSLSLFLSQGRVTRRGRRDSPPCPCHRTPPQKGTFLGLIFFSIPAPQTYWDFASTKSIEGLP